MRIPILPVAVGVVVLGTINAVILSDSRLDKVYQVMQDTSQYSWENGTKAEAVLQRTYPSLSVFSPTSPFPLPSPLPTGDVSQIIDIAQTTLQNRPSSNGNADSLLQDGAAADPASLGIAVLLANTSTGNGQVNGVGYGDAARAEVNYLLEDVPKVPPFLAYYGVVNSNQTLVQTAYTQCQLYRNALRQPSGLWEHIAQGSGTSDPGLWATGNGWAAYGMLRVLATILKSSYSGAMSSQRSDLQSWTEEILSAAQGYVVSDDAPGYEAWLKIFFQSSNGLLHNYIDQTGTFEDPAGSALIAATGLRLSTLGLTSSYVPFSLTLLSAVSTKVNSTGYLTQAVNPLDFSQQGDSSPEGQSFVILAYAAYNDWDKAGRAGYNGSSDSPLGADSGVGRGVEVVGLGVVCLLASVVGLSLLS